MAEDPKQDDTKKGGTTQGDTTQGDTTAENDPKNGDSPTAKHLRAHFKNIFAAEAPLEKAKQPITEEEKQKVKEAILQHNKVLKEMVEKQKDRFGEKRQKVKSERFKENFVKPIEEALKKKAKIMREQMHAASEDKKYANETHFVNDAINNAIANAKRIEELAAAKEKPPIPKKDI